MAEKSKAWSKRVTLANDNICKPKKYSFENIKELRLENIAIEEGATMITLFLANQSSSQYLSAIKKVIKKSLAENDIGYLSKFIIYCNNNGVLDISYQKKDSENNRLTNVEEARLNEFLISYYYFLRKQ